jgi:7-cyano-7-deazaguanine reductase
VNTAREAWRARYPALMMSPHDHGPLGKTVAYSGSYDASLLFPIARATNRAALGIEGPLPFHGVDIWNAYELSWLDARGKPCVALGEFRVPAASANIIESKSFKLYLNSFNRERLSGTDQLHTRLARDLSGAVGAEVAIRLTLPAEFAALSFADLAGDSIDDLALDIDDYGPPDAAQLRLARDASVIAESLTSNLLKSNCPVTGQPDWASVQISYHGRRISFRFASTPSSTSTASSGCIRT